jgi:hypothetical protein
MKKLYLLIAGAAFSFYSCSQVEEGNAPVAKEEAQSGELVVKTKAMETPETQAFKGNDIKSFNVETGEITFINLTYSDICNSLAYDRKFVFYLEDDSLFTATAVGVFSSFIMNDLVFYYDGKRMYLKDGYPDILIYSNPNLNEQQRRERAEATEKRKPAWERFIRYLDENNLLTDRDSDVSADDEPLPDIPVPPVIYDLSATITLEEGLTSTVFIGKCILSFNPETREIVFDGYNILSNLYEFAPIQLDIFREGTHLLSAIVITSDTPQTVNDLVFLIETKKQDGFYWMNEFKYYIPDGYPALENLELGREEAQRIREENAQKRKAGWDAFIRYLTDAKKIIE